MNRPDSVSLVIATYNWPEALELCLRSVAVQSVLPDEILIADDGSTDTTALMIERLRTLFTVPLRHIWQEDTGFRLAQIRNKANAAASGSYIIQIDGDLILHPEFIRDHIRAARKGCFVGGSRVLLSREKSKLHFAEKLIRVGFFDKGLSNRTNGMHLPLTSNLLACFFEARNIRSIRGCNMAYWKSDFVAVNGYDERFEGWGKEDTDLVLRLYRYGLHRRFFKWQGIVYHLFHREADRTQLGANEALLKSVSQEYRCVKGVDQYL